ncbi:MAG: 16S rRNA processing protein RimM [Spirochaetales bacterium]|nr:16S rRNA processing protein RimM [Spirochaetales bacterium]
MGQIVVGKIRTSHGVKGDLKVVSSSGEYDHFQNFKTVVLKKGNRSKTYEVESVKGSGSATLLKLKGIDTPEDGKLYAGYDILVDEEFKVPCYEGEYYHTDLVGCNLIFEEKSLATVISVLDGGLNDLLEVTKEIDGNVVLVPFRDEFVGKVDITKKQIELKVDWILE